MSTDGWVGERAKGKARLPTRERQPQNLFSLRQARRSALYTLVMVPVCQALPGHSWEGEMVSLRTLRELPGHWGRVFEQHKTEPALREGRISII